VRACRAQVETFDTVGFVSSLAAAVGVDPSLVSLEVSAGSVVVVATIVLPTVDVSDVVGGSGTGGGGLLGGGGLGLSAFDPAEIAAQAARLYRARANARVRLGEPQLNPSHQP